jgi:hypothetical protein
MNGRRWTRAGAERAASIEGRSGERGRRGISFRKNPISKFFWPQVFDIAHFRQIKICGNLEDRNLNGA